MLGLSKLVQASSKEAKDTSLENPLSQQIQHELSAAGIRLTKWLAPKMIWFFDTRTSSVKYSGGGGASSQVTFLYPLGRSPFRRPILLLILIP